MNKTGFEMRKILIKRHPFCSKITLSNLEVYVLSCFHPIQSSPITWPSASKKHKPITGPAFLRRSQVSISAITGIELQPLGDMQSQYQFNRLAKELLKATLNYNKKPRRFKHFICFKTFAWSPASVVAFLLKDSLISHLLTSCVHNGISSYEYIELLFNWRKLNDLHWSHINLLLLWNEDQDSFWVV